MPNTTFNHRLYISSIKRYKIKTNSMYRCFINRDNEFKMHLSLIDFWKLCMYKIFICRNTLEYISTYIVHDSILVQKISYCLILYFIYTGHELCIIMQPYCLKYYEKIVPIDKEKTIISTLRQLFSTSPVRLAIVCLSIFVSLLRAEVFIIIHLAKF